MTQAEWAELRLPRHLIERASKDGEFAWSIDDVPAVIEAARDANLASIGGQLQFRFPGATCECYWVEVDTYKSVPSWASWQERVDRTAAVARAEFALLLRKFNFLAEGRNSFPEVFAETERRGQAGSGSCDVVCLVSPGRKGVRRHGIFRNVTRTILSIEVNTYWHTPCSVG
jgi:hypothetical protein